MSIDVLNEFSKEEIIRWLREKGMLLNRVRRSDLLFARWKTQCEALRVDYDAELGRWDAEAPDFTKRDALAAQCNAATDINEKLRLLREIEPYDRALKDHLDRIQKLDARQKRVDQLYRDVAKAQEQET